VDQIDRPSQTPPLSANVVAYGSKSVLGFAAKRQWRPGVWSGEAFDYVNVQRALRDAFLNADAEFVALAEAEQAASARGWTHVFIRPSNDDKAFAGLAIGVADLPAWRERQLGTGYLNDASLEVAVAAPKALLREWRLVVVDRSVVAASQYRAGVDRAVVPGCPRAISVFAESASARYEPARVFVMDVAEIEGGALAVVELNAFNSADLYGCNISDVVNRVTEAATA
jgi:hypothetical protein